MNIIVVSNTCSKEMYSDVFEIRKEKFIDPTQKFLEQIISGLSKIDDCNVLAISSLPVSASTCNKYIFKKKVEYSNNVKYIYSRFINGKILRYLTTFFSVLVDTLSNVKGMQHDNTVMICDVLVPEVAFAARIIGKIFHIKTIAIVTDIPTWATDMKQRKQNTLKQKAVSLYEGFSAHELEKYDAYIYITNYMNDLINKKGKPYITVEGSIEASNDNSMLYKKAQGKIVMYAGGVYKKYGVEKLVKAFKKANIPDCELHIYGSGSYVQELENECKNNPNIKYKGCVLNTELVNLECNATLLVNPRNTEEIYTKYSFPSKTLEYMSSGTPVLTTRLLGIPEEYNDYLYFFEKEDIDSMAQCLKEILGKPLDELEIKGKLARKFVLDNKNNIVQGKSIIRFVQDELMHCKVL